MDERRLKRSEVIYKTRGKVFYQDLQTTRSGSETQGVAEVFFNRRQGVWIPDETLFQVFDIAS